jgi:hypothetical protein
MMVLFSILVIVSAVFFGVIGADKVLLLAPLFVIGYAGVTWQWGRSALAKRRFPRLFWPWLLFLVWAVVAWACSESPNESAILVLQAGLAVGLFGVCQPLMTTFRSSRWVLGTFICLVMMLSLYGVVHHLRAPEMVLWAERYTDHYIATNPRLASTYICPNHFAHLIVMILPFCMALVAIAQSGLYLRVLAGYSFFACLPALHMSESRAAWLGTMASVGVTVCLMALRKSRKLFALLVVLVPLMGVLTLAGAWKVSEPFQRRMKPVVEFAQQVANEGWDADFKDFRPKVWKDTLTMTKDAGATGFGPGVYRYAFPTYRERERSVQRITGHPHQEYLELIIDYGWVGFGLFALAWCYGGVRMLWWVLKTPNRHHALVGTAFLGAMAGTMVHSAFDFEMRVFPNVMMFAVLAACVAGLMGAGSGAASGRKPEEADERRGGGGLLASGMQWMLAGVYLVAGVMCLQVVSSSVLRGLGDVALSSAQAPAVDLSGEGAGFDALLEEAEGYYLRALKWDATNWRAYKGLGDLSFRRRYYALDMADKLAYALQEHGWFEEVLKHNPHDADSMMAFGRAKLFNAKNPDLRVVAAELKEDGFKWMAESCRYKKFNEAFWWHYGVALRQDGRLDEALAAFERGRSVRSTASIRHNIQWIRRVQRQLEEHGEAAFPQEPAVSADDIQELEALFDQFE